MMAVMTRRKKSGPVLEQGIPKNYGKKVESLDSLERGSLEALLASKISIAGGRTKPLKSGNLIIELSTIDVDDPLEYGAKLTATRNIRNDPLARLHSHHQIDDAQFYAGRAYQRDWETAERVKARAFVEQGIIVAKLDDHRLDEFERQFLKNIGSKLFGQKPEA